ncbi:MAG: aldehyde dehydrogenase family protein, partial [Myxococcales bacterium]|nr:aldehyde dehydrogenase family protein [Myxococcales bacterium]
MSTYLSRLGLEAVNPGAATTSGFLATTGREVPSFDPSTGEALGSVRLASVDDYEKVVTEAQRVFADWRMLPAPKRGEILREVGEALRQHKDDLGMLITREVGKVTSEGLGEVQESIDMADLAVGMSRQLNGLTMH